MLIGLLAEAGLPDEAASCASPPKVERMPPSQSPEAGLLLGVLAAGEGDESDANQSPMAFSPSLVFPFCSGVPCAGLLVGKQLRECGFRNFVPQISRFGQLFLPSLDDYPRLHTHYSRDS